MKFSKNVLTYCLLVLPLSIYWAIAGVSKAIGVLLGTLPESGTWASTFPGWTLLTLAIAECATAVLILSGKTVLGLVLGSLLLASFVVALAVWPPNEGQTCGCLGALPLFEQIDPFSKIVFFAGTHALLMALIHRVPLNATQRSTT